MKEQCTSLAIDQHRFGSGLSLYDCVSPCSRVKMEPVHHSYSGRVLTIHVGLVGRQLQETERSVFKFSASFLWFPLNTFLKCLIWKTIRVLLSRSCLSIALAKVSPSDTRARALSGQDWLLPVGLNTSGHPIHLFSGGGGGGEYQKLLVRLDELSLEIWPLGLIQKPHQIVSFVFVCFRNVHKLWYFIAKKPSPPLIAKALRLWQITRSGSNNPIC